jgi:hypothetical protein
VSRQVEAVNRASRSGFTPCNSGLPGHADGPRLQGSGTGCGDRHPDVAAGEDAVGRDIPRTLERDATPPLRVVRPSATN